MAFFKEKYDAIVIGGALAGMSSALVLASEGKDVLVLERHNLPGGLATSYVRGSYEIEATLHEMMAIGEKEHPFKIREFLESMGVDIDWLRVPDAYRLFVPNLDIDITLHAGFTGFIDNDIYKPGEFLMAHEIDKVYPNTFSEVNRFMNLCTEVYNSVNILSVRPISKLGMVLHHANFVRTAGYSTKDVLDTFNLPDKVKDILKAYWVYIGSPLEDLPFTIYAVLMSDYFVGGSYVPRYTSHEMSLRMVERLYQLGVQYEYEQEVDKILVKNGHVYGVRLKSGELIFSNYVVCSAYPNTCYGKMIEPKEEIPSMAIKNMNSRDMGLSCISVILILDIPKEELNINSYSLFSSESDMDLDKLFKQTYTKGPYDYLTTICLNYANPECTKEGTSSLSITYLPHPSSFLDVEAKDYFKLKRKIAREMIETVSKRLGVNLFDHILEVEVEMPHTIAHYSSSYMGGIYGYRHSMNDHIIARILMQDTENYIKGLAFCGAHAMTGDGMSPCINSGRNAASLLLKQMKEEAK